MDLDAACFRWCRLLCHTEGAPSGDAEGEEGRLFPPLPVKGTSPGKLPRTSGRSHREGECDRQGWREAHSAIPALYPSAHRPNVGHSGEVPRFRFPVSHWCERRDSNPHGFPRQILSLVRLPIPPLSQAHVMPQSSSRSRLKIERKAHENGTVHLHCTVAQKFAPGPPGQPVQLKANPRSRRELSSP